MLIIANGLNGQYLRNFLINAPAEIQWVKAAVAYADGSPELIDFCIKKGIVLHFWGRLDESFPVKSNILQQFLRLGPNYQCKLVWKYYHPKVIWFSGYGAYIGSANLTSNGWNTNIECGVWFDDSDLEEQGLIGELEGIFHQIDRYAEPLTDELYKRLKELESSYEHQNTELSKQRSKLSDEFSKKIVPFLGKRFGGLAKVVTRADAHEERKREFMDEWNNTLQLLRKIAEQVVLDENRPKWVGADVPRGVQLDQFLHAFYYRKVFQGNRSHHKEFYERNKSNPQAALIEVMQWWKSSTQSDFVDEYDFMYRRAPFLITHLSKEKLPNLTQDEFVEVCTKVHAFVTSARQTKNEIIGLPSGTHLETPERAKYVARWLWSARSKNGSNPIQMLFYVLYGGSPEDITERVWQSSYIEDWHIRRIGVGSMGEIVGWALPDRFPPRNGRTSKALVALGYDVEVHSDS